MSSRVPPQSLIPTKEDLVTRVSVGSASVPAVLIGDAAHSLPEIHSHDDINHVVYDAINLARMIRDRQYDDSQFQRIPEEFYKLALPRWDKYRLEWEERIAKLYGLEEKLKWTKIEQAICLPRPPISRNFGEPPRADFFGSGPDVEEFHNQMTKYYDRIEKVDTSRRASTDRRNEIRDQLRWREGGRDVPADEEAGADGGKEEGKEEEKEEGKEEGNEEAKVEGKEERKEERKEKGKEDKIIVKYVDTWFG